MLNKKNVKNKKILFYIKKYYIAFIIVAASVAIDLFTKYLATNLLTWKVLENGKLLSEEKFVIDGFWYFQYARNYGGGWSILSGQMWFFYLITIISIPVFIYFLKDFDLKKRPLYSIGFALMLGGTLGNFYERIVNGYVTDFLGFIIFTYNYPIFNLADSCLVIGAILLVIQLLFFSSQVTIFDKKINKINDNNNCNNSDTNSDANIDSQKENNIQANEEENIIDNKNE